MSFGAAFILSTWLILIISAHEGFWWAYPPLVIVAIWGFLGDFLTITQSILRTDISERGGWVFLLKYVVVAALVLFGIAGAGLLLVLGFMLTGYIFSAHTWSEFFWRLSFGLEAAAIFSIGHVLVHAFDGKRRYTFRHAIKFGGAVFALHVLGFPLLYAFYHFIQPGRDSSLAIGLAFLLLAFFALFGFGYASFRLIDGPETEQPPIDFGGIAHSAWQFLRSLRKEQATPHHTGSQPTPQQTEVVREIRTGG